MNASGTSTPVNAIRATRRRRYAARAGPYVLVLAVLALWEIGVRIGGVPAYLLPTPSSIVRRIVTDWRPLLGHTAVTTGEILVGYLLAVVISIPLAALLARFRPLETAVYPLLVASQTIPKVAIAPLLVVWFGFGLLPKILIVFLICFFPIVVDALVGFRSVPREVLWLARSMGASQWKTFRKISIPAALPHLFAGLKVAGTLAVVGAVVGEFVAADRGLGYQLIVANGVMDVQLSFALLLMLSALGVLLNALIELLERAALPWHVSQRVGAVAPAATGARA